MNIEICLGTRDVGTTAVVTTRRWFSTKVSKYICHRASPVMGGQWICESSGLEASSELQSKLNYAAQAAASLAENKRGSAYANKAQDAVAAS
jgi:hypothetical protein